MKAIFIFRIWIPTFDIGDQFLNELILPWSGSFRNKGNMFWQKILHPAWFNPINSWVGACQRYISNWFDTLLEYFTRVLQKICLNRQYVFFLNNLPTRLLSIFYVSTYIWRDYLLLFLLLATKVCIEKKNLIIFQSRSAPKSRQNFGKPSKMPNIWQKKEIIWKAPSLCSTCVKIDF